jgi:NADPH:quinone reductase-like Zn-dependent oxidoreductase
LNKILRGKNESAIHRSRTEGGIFEFHDTPTPASGGGEVLIKVGAAGTDRGELLARPLLRSDNPVLRPMRSGGEFAGGVASLGEGMTSWKVGARVMGAARRPTRHTFIAWALSERANLKWARRALRNFVQMIEQS